MWVRECTEKVKWWLRHYNPGHSTTLASLFIVVKLNSSAVDELHFESSYSLVLND